jgi:hypothetical protein
VSAVDLLLLLLLLLLLFYSRKDRNKLFIAAVPRQAPGDPSSFRTGWYGEACPPQTPHACPDAIPGRRGGKLATNRLSYDTACVEPKSLNNYGCKKYLERKLQR